MEREGFRRGQTGGIRGMLKSGKCQFSSVLLRVNVSPL